LGQLGCFSFHEQKNMSTLGEGGMVTTNSPELYERVRGYKSHCARVIGKSSKYLTLSDKVTEEALAKNRFWYQDFDDCGYNFRMNDVTATVGICQLKKLPKLNENRQKAAKFMLDNLQTIPSIQLPIPPSHISHVYHLFPIQIDPKKAKISRDDFIFKLRKDFGIKCGIHYMPLVQTTAFKTRGYSEKDVPIACKRWPNLVTLPIHPRMTDEALQYLVESIKKII
jgi:perosamine synthetase